jgi:hypothetical protein
MRAYLRAVRRHWGSLVVTGAIPAALGLIVAQYRAWKEIKERLDPLDAEIQRQKGIAQREQFEQETVRIIDLVPGEGSNVVHAKNFDHCKILGPAVLDATQGTFEQCSFHESGFIPIAPGTPIGNHPGIVVLVNCHFARCELRKVALLGTAAEIAEWHKHGITWTP